MLAVFIRNWVGTNIPIIQNNLIYENDIGIAYGISRQEAYAISPTIIQNNTITLNGIGLQMSSAEDYLLVNNNIQGNTNYSLYLTTGSNFNASYNWWGTTDNQAINQTIYDFKNDFNLGKVNFVPILSAPNSQAPTYPPSPTQTPNPTPVIPEFPLAATALVLILSLTITTAILAKKRKTTQSYFAL